jgi:hypothetical protein
LDAFRKTEPPAPPLTQSIRGGGVAMPVYVRGSVDRKGEIAPPGFLQILRSDSETHADAAPASAAFNRLGLARAIASRDNPLTARVIVNRVWHHYFGRGLVSTPSNFGTLGDPPSHPELLDYLAVEFMNHGWSLRWLLREIALSRVTELMSAADPANMNRDPGNRLLWRWAPRRLDFEAWRDAILLVSGLLDRSEGGPSLPVDEHSRRTIYSKISRSKLDPTLMAFDFPDANVSNEKRAQTMVPQQQLYAINSPFLTKAAKALAKRIESAAQDDPARVIAAYRLAHGRNPGKDEQEFVLRYLSSVRMNPGDQLQPWERVAHAMLAANEISWLP